MAAKISTTAKIYKPLDPTEFNDKKTKFSDVKITKDGSKYIYTEYDSKQFLVVIRGCKILSFIEGKNLFVQLSDPNAIEMIRKYEQTLVNKCISDSLSWFGEQYNEEESSNAIKSIILSNPNFPDSYTLSLPLSDKFLVKSKVSDIADNDDIDIKTKLAKFNLIDVCVNFKSIKINKAEYNIIVECNQANITSVGKSGDFKNTAILPQNFTSGKITLSKLITKNYEGKNGQPDINTKTADVLYDKNKLRCTFKDINSRIFKFIKDGNEDSTSYSLSLRLPKNSDERKMFESIYDETFKIISTGDNCKEYYDKKYTPKQLKTIIKNILSYNKVDQEKIKKGEEPSNEPSIYFKVLFDKKQIGKGNKFYGKFMNDVDKKPIDNVDELLGKDLNITSLEAYCKGVSFHAKGTSIIFVVDKCYINFDVPVYDMDSVDTTSVDDDVEDDEDESVSANKIEEVSAETEEAVNSDAESVVESESEDEELKAAAAAEALKLSKMKGKTGKK